MKYLLCATVACGLLGAAEGYANDVYQLVEIENADVSNLPLGAVIKNHTVETVKYFDMKTGMAVAADERVDGVKYQEVKEITSVPHYYMPVLNETEFGDLANKNPENAMYFKFEKDDKGFPVLIEGTKEDHDYTFYKDEARETVTSFADRVVNDGSVDLINKNFEGISGTENGLAIYNQQNGNIGKITGDFIKNVTTGETNVHGAILNEGHIGEIAANFVSNKLVETVGKSVATAGSAIANKGTIDKIKGTFLNNVTNGEYWIAGGSIYNGETGSIKDIEGIFIGNQVDTIRSHALGPAIYNEGKIDHIKGIFVGNTGVVREGQRLTNTNGAIRNAGTIGTLEGVFINNSHGGSNIYSYGGAIRGGEYEKIIGDFIGNYSMSGGGAIFAVEADYVGGNFINNMAVLDSGAIAHLNMERESMVTVEANFIGNHAGTHGGAVVSEGHDMSIKGDFIGNYIKNIKSVQNDATNDFFKYTSFGGAITWDDCNGGKILAINGNFIDNYVESEQSKVFGARFQTIMTMAAQ